ncbi:MFS transporter [Thalassiella azotivora]
MDPAPAPDPEPGAPRLRSPAGRGLLTATVLGSGVAFLDATVVNVALPTIGRDLGASLAQLQWTVNGYTLSLAALILLGGSLGDRLGRRRVFVAGVVWFAVASVACALAPDAGWLVAARVLQGVGGALLTPGSLALLQSGLHPDDRATAIGLWSGLSGVSTAVGPFVGGWLVALDWRWVFWVNVPLAALTVWLALRHAPESRDDTAAGRVDAPGAVLGALALGALTYALVAAPEPGSGGRAALAGALAVLGGAAFVLRQRRARHPMVPPRLFADRVFTIVNAETLLVYAALSGMSFLLVLHLQVSLGYSPLAAGVAMLPVTVLLTAFSGPAGALGQRVGPRLPLTLGPAVAAAGLLLLVPLRAGDGYWLDQLPGLVLFGAGLTLLVAPLTATVMAAPPAHLVGTASGVNNAVARTGGLLAVAALPAVAGISGQAYADPDRLTPAYAVGMATCVGLLAAGAVVGLLGLPRGARLRQAPAPTSGRDRPPGT